MSRLALSLIALLSLAGAARAEVEDRYGPAREGLRGSAPVLSGRALLTWSSKQRQERLRPPAPSGAAQGGAPPPRQAWPSQASATRQPVPLPKSIYEVAPPPAVAAPARAYQSRQAPTGQAYAPRGQSLQPRRYSVGREFGVEPDRIALPDPSVLAYAPEVAVAVLAQQERDKASGDPGPASPADLDMMEQRQQDLQRAEARQKVQAENRARKLK